MTGTAPSDGAGRDSELSSESSSITIGTPLNRDYLAKRFTDIGFQPEDIEELLDQYEQYPLTLPVSDIPMQRVSEVLTNCGFITSGTCDGHAHNTPSIFLHTENKDHLRHLSHIVIRESRATHFDWTLRAWSSNPFSNPDNPMAHVLEPLSNSNSPVDPTKDYQRLKYDLDILGLAVLDYFNDIAAHEQAQQQELQEKIDRGLAPVSERVETMANLSVEFGTMPGGSPIRPQIQFIWDGEQEDYKEKGEIIEEFLDGFIVLTERPVNMWVKAFGDGIIPVADGYYLAHLSLIHI